MEVPNNKQILLANIKSSRESLDSSSLTVFLSYLLSFILIFVVAINFNDNPFAIFLTVGLLIFITASIHYWNNDFQKELFGQLERDIITLKSALIADSQAVTIIRDHEVLSIDDRIKKQGINYKQEEFGEVKALISEQNIPLDLEDEIIKTIQQFATLNKTDTSNKVFAFDSNKALEIKIIETDYPRNTLLLKSFSTPKDIFDNYLNTISIACYELDNVGHLNDCSSYFAKTLGYNKKTLLAGSYFFADLLEYKNTTNQSAVSKIDFLAMLGNWQGIVKLKTKFNEPVPFFILHKSILDRYGRIEKICGYAIKIFDSSIAYHTLDKESTWLDYSWRCFFRDSPYPVAIVNLIGSIERVNLSFTNILPASLNTNDLPFADIFLEEDQQLINEELKLVIASKITPKPLKNMRLKNKEGFFDIYLGRITNLQGDITGLMVRATDMTSQKELQDNLSHAQRMQTMGQLVGSVAHDFNNLLTAISGFCDLLFLKHSVGDPSFAHIMQIKQNSDRAANLVKRLLAFSRKQTLQLTIVELPQLFSDFTTLIKRLIGPEIKLTMNIAPDVWPVKIDPVQMEQVILNLVVNAHQAFSQNGELSIELKNESIKNPLNYLEGYYSPDSDNFPISGDYICIVVADNGSGIPKEILPKIFEPFFTTKQERSGTGLGLSTVYGIISQSEGFIYVKSQPGVGTKFKILFKRQVKEKVAKKTKVELVKDDNRLITSPNNYTIALVEDEESVRIFTKNVLINRGYNVIEFSSAMKAYHSMSEFIDKVDLIISDVVMPEMTGPAFIKEVNKLNPKIPVIFVSGYAEEAFNDEYGSDRNFHFLPKPYSLKSLNAMVAKVLVS